jgi:DNA-binding HxlR family transcriptional regulator
MTKNKFACGLDVALFVLGAKWKPLILFHLAHDARRYGELRRAVSSVSDKVDVERIEARRDRSRRRPAAQLS